MKQIKTLNDLAFFGAKPLFRKTLHVGRPNICNRNSFLKKVKKIFNSRCLTNNGPFVQEFEKRLTALLGVKHCIATCNATVGLQVASRALELKGEVILPSFTFIASAHALRWQGITSVFCDINPRTGCLDPEKIERLITSKTTGILGVHVWGFPCDVARLVKIARKHKLKMLFDAAHAFGGSHGTRMIGNFGDAEVFSFHATKVLNTFEGGAITTNDDALAKKIRSLINFGFSTYDTVDSLGTNAKMSEVSAAMGLASLESFDRFIMTNYKNYSTYLKELRAIPGITLKKFSGERQYNYHYIVIEVDSKKAGFDRDFLMRLLHAEGVLARRYFYPGCHKHAPYSEDIKKAYFLSKTELLSDRVLCLPTGTAVNVVDIRKICQLIRLVVKKQRDFPQ